MMKRKIILALTLILISIVVFFQSAQAIDFNESFGIRNNIRFYDPNYGCTPFGNSKISSLNDIVINEDGKHWLENYKLKEKLTQEIVSNGKTRKQLYLEAVKQAGLTEESWMILASVDVRERGLSLTKTILNGRDPFGTSAKNSTDGIASGNDYFDDLLKGTQVMIGKAKSNGFDLKTSDQFTAENIGKTFLSYNRGAMYPKVGLTWSDSGYVMNFTNNYAYNGRLDHPDYCKIARKHGYKCDHKDSRAGALAILVYINNDFSSSEESGSSIDSNLTNCHNTNEFFGSLMEVYQRYAWTEYYDYGTFQAMNPKDPTYRTDPVLRQAPGGNQGQDCAAWTRFAMIKSGIDPNYGYLKDARRPGIYGGVPNNVTYLNSSYSGWEKISSKVYGRKIDPALLKPGDIAVCSFGRHIYFYVGDGIFSSASYSGENGSVAKGRFPMKGSANECQTYGSFVDFYRKVRKSE